MKIENKFEIGDIITTDGDGTGRIVSINYTTGMLCAVRKGFIGRVRFCTKIENARYVPLQTMLSEVKASQLGEMIKGLFSDKAKADMVFRQVWSENEKQLMDIYGPESYVDHIDPSTVSISKEDAFALNLVWEDMNECAAIFFIRKGVKAHYDELRQQSGEATDHLKHKEQ